MRPSRAPSPSTAGLLRRAERPRRRIDDALEKGLKAMRSIMPSSRISCKPGGTHGSRGAVQQWFGGTQVATSSTCPGHASSCKPGGTIYIYNNKRTSMAVRMAAVERYSSDYKLWLQAIKCDLVVTS